MKELNHYKLFADLFRYPDEKLSNNAQAFYREVKNSFPMLSEKLNEFVETITKSSSKQQQEYYLKTFDVNAVCYLDVGYVMFGEDYKRGQLLVNLQNEHKNAGVDCGNELADHLPNVLCLLARSSDPDFITELGFIITAPAIRFMLTKFKNIDNYYKDLLGILLDMLQIDFPGDGLKEYAFADEMFLGNNEFLMPSPKMTVCDSNCKQKRF
jgi:nitrate reductase molybdenum cofactor assembly chaperone